MGIGYHVVEALIRERQHRPLEGDVILIGRQTVYFPPESILELLEEHGVDVSNIRPDEIKTGGGSTSNFPDVDGKNLITDAELLRLLGVPKVLALDHSDYEGAEIIHDLTKPIPPNLQGCADFILDGSTLDNVFDPAMVIRNFGGMLRPGGRLITINMYSNHYEPYVMLPPLWFLDYFVANGFNDCKVYILVINHENPDEANMGHSKSKTSVFTIDTDALLDPARSVTPFSYSRIMSKIVIAEKGTNSTSDLMPSQQQYRSALEWESYRRNLRHMKSSTRPHLVRTKGDIDLFDIRGGHLFIAEDFTARDPSTEVCKLYINYMRGGCLSMPGDFTARDSWTEIRKLRQRSAYS
jgi:hypothetical protein